MHGTLFILLMTASVFAATSALADGRTRIGTARIFDNDKIGDGEDRWRTGSYALSYVHGPRWDGELSDEFGELLEVRVRTEIIAPADLTNPVIGTDRRYVGALSFGLHTHFERKSYDVRLGFDVVATGPQTGVGGFQKWAHGVLGAPAPQVLGSQIANAFYPTVSGEIARDIEIGSGGTTNFRPFMEAQIGVENLVRFGADIYFGAPFGDDLYVRDVTTGQRVVAVKGSKKPGFSFTLGADVAYVASSQYLPSSGGYNVTSPRLRARAGVVYEQAHVGMFYGLTWLGREFAAQSASSQIVGSLSMKIKF